MDLLPVVRRCATLERAAAAIYTALAAGCAADEELAGLWTHLAADEVGHAEKIEAWAALLAAEPPEHRTAESGFDAVVDELDALVTASRAAAAHARDPEDAFRIALALETSELDAVYGALLQASPIARYPDAATSARHEASDHHRRLVAVVERRSQDPGNLLRARLLAASHPEG